MINKTRSHRLPLIAGLLAKNKEAANHLLQRRGLPVPPFIVVPEMGEKAARFLEASASVVVKPLDASGSTGVTLDVRTREQLVEAIRRAGRSSGSILVQRFVPGADYRVLVIGGKVAAVTGYRPAYVIGNGSSSVRELIRRLNETRIRRRSIGEMEAFAEIKADSPRLKAVLDKQGAALDDLIPAGARLGCLIFTMLRPARSAKFTPIARIPSARPTPKWPSRLRERCRLMSPASICAAPISAGP